MMNKFFMAALASIALLAACKDDEEPNTEKPEDGNYTGLVLNEICGGDSNSDDDWVEIYNTSSVAINLQGVTITKIDEDGISEKLYTYPEGATLAAGAYDVKSRTSNELAAKISNSKQVSIVLEMPSGTQIDIFDKDTEVGENGSHSLGGSYARIPDGTGKWTIVSKATKGAANSRLSGVYPPGSSAPAICHGPEWSDHHDLPSLHCRVFCADAEKCKSNEEK